MQLITQENHRSFVASPCSSGWAFFAGRSVNIISPTPRLFCKCGFQRSYRRSLCKVRIHRALKTARWRRVLRKLNNRRSKSSSSSTSETQCDQFSKWEWTLSIPFRVCTCRAWKPGAIPGFLQKSGHVHEEKWDFRRSGFAKSARERTEWDGSCWRA